MPPTHPRRPRTPTYLVVSRTVAAARSVCALRDDPPLGSRRNQGNVPGCCKTKPMPLYYVMINDSFIVAGIIAGCFLALRHARLSGMPRRLFVRASLYCVVGAVMGVLMSSFLCLIGKTDSHFALRGDLQIVLACACVPPVAWAICRRISLAILADIAAPSLLLAVAFARISCFLKGCCWGDVCCTPSLVDSVLDAADRWQVYTVPAISGPNWPLAVTFPKGSHAYEQHLLLGLLDGSLPGSLPCHPVQLYETALMAAAALVLSWWYPRRRFPLQVFSLACLAFAAIRFCLEFLRADHSAFWHGMTKAQVSSAAFAVAAISLFAAAMLSYCRSRPAQAP